MTQRRNQTIRLGDFEISSDRDFVVLTCRRCGQDASDWTGSIPVDEILADACSHGCPEVPETEEDIDAQR